MIMRFKDAPVGARFRFEDDGNIYVKIHASGDGLTVTWHGNEQKHQAYGCWLDEENGIDFDTEIELL